MKNSDKGIAIIAYLKWNFKENIFVDLPCYSNSTVQDDFKKIIWKNCNSREQISDEELENVKIIILLTDNPNAPNDFGESPIYWAAYNGRIEIVKILVPLTDNPNAPKNDGETPIYCAAIYGHTEIVKILVPLTDNPNAPDMAPIQVAANSEICGILKTQNSG